ncbi:MAG: hypothetical protein ACLQVW_30895, partial [Limisphaerales bacterium]
MYLEDDPIRFVEGAAALTFEKVTREAATVFACRDAAAAYIRRAKLCPDPNKVIVAIVRLLPSEAAASIVVPIEALP